MRLKHGKAGNIARLTSSATANVTCHLRRDQLGRDGKLDVRADAPERQAVLGPWTLLVAAVIGEGRTSTISLSSIVLQVFSTRRRGEKIGTQLLPSSGLLFLHLCENVRWFAQRRLPFYCMQYAT